MLAEVEIDHRVEKQAFAKAVPTCREALIDAQYELSQSRRFATIVLLTGVSGAGKSETVNRLLTWMDPRYIETLAIGRDETDEQRARPYMWRFWQILPPKGRITILSSIGTPNLSFCTPKEKSVIPSFSNGSARSTASNEC
jgi:AMP-polyphosphate phosphotransferase